MNDSVYVGNAGKDAALDRRWLLGHFKDVGDPRHSEAVEIKWDVRIIPAVGLAGCLVLAFALPVPSVITGAAVLIVGAVAYGIHHSIAPQE